MHPGTLRALELDRIVLVVTGLAVTTLGRDRLADLHPLTTTAEVLAAQRATTEGTRFLADYPGFPLRAPSDLGEIIDALGVEGRGLEPMRLLGWSGYLESIEQSRQAITKVGAAFPLLRMLVETVSSFKQEIADVRRKVEPSGEVADNASPALASIRERLRRQKQRLRTTLDGFLRGRDAKYLQEQVVTDRSGRHVLMVRAEHRAAIPGIVHGGSASGASLFVEPLETVEINNDIVALEEQEAEEVRRILLELTDAFRRRPEELERTIEVATELDVIQARARFSIMVGGVEPVIAADGTFDLMAARHPLLVLRGRESFSADDSRGSENDSRPLSPVPVDIHMRPPNRVLIITGPNTGGKTVALKTAGLFVAMAQAGLHVPAAPGSKLPVFKSLFADIGDEQSISASLSTFSAHIANIVAMNRNLALPALVLLDEVGAGTDPVEGGALGIAVIDHFRTRGAHLVATTHYDSLKSYASTTEGVESAAFGFNPETFAPTYSLQYGSPGRSLAIEIAARLGMPPSVIAKARESLSDREKQLAEHLARVDEDVRRLEQDRREVSRERAALADAERKLRSREDSVREREDTYRRRLDAKLDEQLREGRREIDAIIEGLKARTTALSDQAARRAAAAISTGETGSARADARSAIEQVVGRLKKGSGSPVHAPARAQQEAVIEPGVRVTVGALGLEGTVLDVHGNHAEIDMNGKRLRAAVRDLRVIGGGVPASGKVKVNVDLQPRTGSLTEINVIGCTVDEALSRLEKFLDESTVTDQQVLRIIHGHGTGQLRRAVAGFLKEHPLVARFETAKMDQGGGGVTVVELKD
ncbi:MAG TPA: endonuclease MutS2 [Vicinamibacterales bacterium]|nr:endonuclease MutS2 [Vicinamibacterales bacterium]